MRTWQHIASLSTGQCTATASAPAHAQPQFETRGAHRAPATRTAHDAEGAAWREGSPDCREKAWPWRRRGGRWRRGAASTAHARSHTHTLRPTSDPRFSGWERWRGSILKAQHRNQDAAGMRLYGDVAGVRLYGDVAGMRLYGDVAGMRLCGDVAGMRLYGDGAWVSFREAALDPRPQTL
eukprot:3844365-Rhodomonas_salina.4